jgi:hypothetical protein
MTRRRLAALVVLLVAIAAVAVVLVVTDGSSTPSGSGSGGSSSAGGATAVQRRNLVETDTEAGTLSYSNPQTVYNRISGTVTWVPAVGQLIKPGQALYKINGEPIILMDGSTSAYRKLEASDVPGNDILELNRDLVRLGFDADGIIVDDEWQAATTDGIDQLQTSLGEKATGKLPLGQVVFLQGAQLISAVDSTVGSAAAGSTAAPSPATSDASGVLDPAPDFVSLESHAATPSVSADTGTMTVGATTTPEATTTPYTSPTTTGTGKKNKKQSKLSKLRAELRQLQAELEALRNAGSHSPSSSPPSSPSSPSSSSNSPSSGSHSPSGSSNSGGGGSATAILTTTSTHLVVTVDLAASSQSEAVVGEHVGVEMPAGNTVDGKVTAVSSVAVTPSSSGNGNSGNGNSGNGNSGNGNSGSSSTIPVTITLKGRLTGAGLDQAAVSVNFAQARARNVLSVPVTALLATGGGNYAVQEAVAPHKLVPVTTGLFAAGFVQISGPGIYSGLQVTDSQG